MLKAGVGKGWPGPLIFIPDPGPFKSQPDRAEKVESVPSPIGPGSARFSPIL